MKVGQCVGFIVRDNVQRWGRALDCVLWSCQRCGLAGIRTRRDPRATTQRLDDRISTEADMRIGIIGAGNIGSNLPRRLTALGHEVSVANSRGPETLASLAQETGTKAVSVPETVRDKDLIVVTSPEKNVPELPAGLFDGVGSDPVVIDTGNYYPQQRDGRIEDIENGMPESRWVERQLGRPVIKVFNNI
ncbi:MAG: NAD(P)-binding domain-containing protein, partial [Microvirga sp.]